MFIDPEFRIKFWYIDENGDETEAEYEINDKAVREVMPQIDLTRLKETVEYNEAKRVEFRKNKRRHKDTNETRDLIRSKISGLFNKGYLEEDGYMNSKVERKQQTAVVQAEIKSVNMTPGNTSFIDNTIEDGASGEKLLFQKLQETLKPYRVLIPEEYRKQHYVGELTGYYHPETKTYNIIPQELYCVGMDATVSGVASSEERIRSQHWQCIPFPIAPEDVLMKFRDNENVEINIDYYSCKQDIFSRNEGIVEKDKMAEKQAIISGAGSGGFKVGLELVRAGIGSLIVADNDIIAYHNVCRHECGIHDVGKYKVDCFKERAADINPNCKIYTFRDLIQHVDPAELDKVIWRGFDYPLLCG